MLPLKRDLVNTEQIRADFFDWSTHWYELKYRFLRSMLVLFFSLIISFCLYDVIWKFFFSFIHRAFPQLRFVSRSIVAPFLLTMEISFLTAIIITVLWATVEVWFFVSPGLTSRESARLRHLLILFILLTTALQLIGLFVFLPISVSFFLKFNRDLVEESVDLLDFMGFVLSFQRGLIWVGLWPFLLKGFIESGWLTYRVLESLRPWIYVLSFFLGMILTPPDVIAQCLLAIPLILLYELIVYSGKVPSQMQQHQDIL